ncbi:hypothetical protein Sjap_020547 [Stephania japonica]|uniref:CAF17 C-terminal domain-containing protein n=1 Tax=Stephania japonica TaxID=461633 RepID=A0AAP0F675_9MAGN
MQHFKFLIPPIQKACYSCRNLLYTPSRLFSQQQNRLEDVGPMASLLKSRSVICFQGPDTFKFLQGLLTNDVQQFCEPITKKTATTPGPNLPSVSYPPIYAAMLTPQGRFLYDFFLYRPSLPEENLNRTGSGPGSTHDGPFKLFADVDASILDEIVECFKKYRLRMNVEIENMSEQLSCWQRFGASISEKSASMVEPEAAAVGWGGGVDRAGVESSKTNSLGWQWHKDPRLEILGFRGIFSSDTTPPLVEADKETDELNYLLWRVEKGVAEGSTEIPKGEAIPLEYNLAGLNAISFDKGCYVGQELIARTHHRGVIRKRLVPVQFLDNNGNELEQEVAPGSEVVDASSNKKIGTVNTALGCRGLGLLRVEEAFKESSRLSIKGQDDVKVVVHKPEWWPAEWSA